MISQLHYIPVSTAPQQKHHRSGSVASQLSLKLHQLCIGAVCPQSQLQNQSHSEARNPAPIKMASNQSLLPVSEWPKAVAGDLVWSGTDATAPVANVIELQPSDIQDVESALDFFKSKELHGDEVSRETFPVSEALEGRLEEAAIAVHNKQGYCVLRGLNPANFSPEDNALIFLGLASYVGNVRGVQDSTGNMISHITVAKQWEAVPDKLRHGVHTTHGMPFHSDMGADVLALHYRQCAHEGGRTQLASAWTIYNDLAANHPGVLETLAAPNWPIQITKARARYVTAPLIQYHDGKIMVSLDPGRLGRQTANKEHVSRNKSNTTTDKDCRRVPTLTQEQLAALETLNNLAHKHEVSVEAQNGDILFVNNWGLLHARDSYSDRIEDSRRHLVRIWLHNEDLSWEVPSHMKNPWIAAFGYHFSDAVDPACAHPRTVINRKYPIAPAPDYHVPKYTAGSAAFLVESSDEEDYADDQAVEDDDEDDFAVDSEL